jgi:hypothetical protein
MGHNTNHVELHYLAVADEVDSVASTAATTLAHYNLSIPNSLAIERDGAHGLRRHLACPGSEHPEHFSFSAVETGTSSLASYCVLWQAVW